ncbi:hypothetical protein EJB05_24824, partial [Eragrostis curvula]
MYTTGNALEDDSTLSVKPPLPPSRSCSFLAPSTAAAALPSSSNLSQRRNKTSLLNGKEQQRFPYRHGQGTAKSFELFIGLMKPRKSKITNMSNHVTIQENIAWLKITVKDWYWLILVKIIKGGCHVNCNV